MKLKLGPQVMNVTPSMAAALLANNPNNRNISSIVTGKYAADMRAGRWCFNGTPVVITNTHRLLDGQHRLTAIVETGISQQMVVFCVDNKEADDVFGSIDIGKKRGLSDTMKILGAENTTTLASAVALLNCYIGDRMLGGTAKVTQAELLSTFEAHPDLAASANATQGEIRTLLSIAPPSAVAFTHYLFGLIDRKQRDTFFASLSTGANLAPGDVVLLLRNTLQRARHVNGIRGGKTRVWVTALIIKAWNAFVKGDAAALLRWSSSEAFPRAVRKNGRVYDVAGSDAGNGVDHAAVAQIAAVAG